MICFAMCGAKPSQNKKTIRIYLNGKELISETINGKNKLD
jgi:hypothetical protein